MKYFPPLLLAITTASPIAAKCHFSLCYPGRFAESDISPANTAIGTSDCTGLTQITGRENKSCARGTWGYVFDADSCEEPCVSYTHGPLHSYITVGGVVHVGVVATYVD